MGNNKRLNAGRPASVREYPLKGKVFCLECGAAMSAVASKLKSGHVYHYYRCPRKNRTHDCNSRPIRVDKLEQLVVDQVRAAIGRPDIRQKALEKMLSVSPAAAEAETISRLEKQREKIQRKLDNALEALLDLGNLPELREKITSLKTELSSTTAEIRQRKAACNTLSSLTPAQMEAVFWKLCSAAMDDTDTVLTIVSRVEVGNDEIRIYTIFDDTPPPKRKSTEDTKDFIQIDGTPSGVP